MTDRELLNSVFPKQVIAELGKVAAKAARKRRKSTVHKPMSLGTADYSG